MSGRKIGTFFTNVQQTSSPPEQQAAQGTAAFVSQGRQFLSVVLAM